MSITPPPAPRPRPTGRVAAGIVSLALLVFAASMAGGVLEAAADRVAHHAENGDTSLAVRVEALNERLDPASRVRREVDPQRQDVLRSYAVVEARPGRILASYTMVVPRESELYRRMANAADRGSLFARDAAHLVGELAVNGRRTTFQPPEIRIEPGAGAVLRFDADPLELPDATSGSSERFFVLLTLPVFGPDSASPEVYLRPGPFRVAAANPVPDEQARGRVVWRRHGAGTSVVDFTLYRTPPHPVPVSTGSIFPRVLRWGEDAHLPAADPLLESACLLVPLLLFLLTVPAGREGGEGWSSPGSVARLLLLGLLLAGLAATAERLDELVRGGGMGASALAHAALPARLALATAAGSKGAAYAVLMLFWPARVLLRWGRSAGEDSGRLVPASPLALFAGVVALGAAVAATMLFPALRDTKSLEGLALPSALALAGAVLALSTLAAELRLGRWALLLVPAALLLFLLVLVQVAVAGPAVVSVALVAAFSLSFTLALARLECVAATGKGLRALPPPALRAVGAALLLLAGFLVWWVVETYGLGSFGVIGTWLLTIEGFQFARVVLATLLLRILHQESRAPAGAFGARALAAGPLLGAVAFFPASAQWYYVPVMFLAGWLVLRQLVAGAGKPETAEEGGAAERALLDELVDVKVFRRTVDAYRTKQLAKVSSGDLEFPDYEAKREHLEGVLAAKEAALRTQAGSRPEAILSRGARVDPWRNAVVNTVWATAFGMPWIVLSLRQAAGWYVHSTLLLLEQALLLAVQWPLYGTFFGYFYARLPGWSGFAKAFWFALAATVPHVVLNVVTLAPADAWRDLGLFALPVLIQMLLLGLANDFAMLRRHGFTWRTLADLHNLGAVTAWFSTLILAIATAVATLLTSQASDLFKRALDAAGSAPPAAQTTGH